MKKLVLDGGNALIKWRTTSSEGSFIAAMAELPEHTYHTIMSRPGIAGMYMMINGAPFVFGEHAERHSITPKLAGAGRYTPGYYGRFVAAALVDAYPDSGGDVMLFASHPPGHAAHRDALLKSAIGTYEIVTKNGTRTYRVVAANAYDEPLGGIMHLVLNNDGVSYQRSELLAGDCLVIDIGGYTTDMIAIRRGGEIDYSLQSTIPLGINKITAELNNAISATYNELSARTGGTMPPARVRRAIETGHFNAAGQSFDVRDLVSEAVNQLLNQFSSAYQSQAGGGVDFDHIVLTGGGSALLLPRLQTILNHGNVLLAEDRDSVHLANVRGGQKLMRLYERIEVM
jgi:hypothetical protein